MKILHVADLHLGRLFDGWSLESDHAEILQQILGAMAEHRPDVLIIAGDIFDRAAPPTSAVRQFNDFLRRVALDTRAAVVMIAGNHDSGDRIGSMAIMTDTRRALIRGPLVADEEPLVLLDQHGPVAFSALPFGYEFAAQECFQGKRIGTLQDVVTAQVAAAHRYVPPGARWVVTAHAFVAGCATSENERPARAGGIDQVEPLTFRGARYVALGHLHRPQQVGRPYIRYSGSPLAFGFDEAGAQKSMCLVNLDAAGHASITTIPFKPQRGVRVLTGTLTELLLMSASNDFIRPVLTDDSPRIDPMKQLRQKFPYACNLTYARDEKMPNASLASADPAKAHQPIEIVSDFLRHVRDRDISDAERDIVTCALTDIGTREATA
jgi:DNA repair protein SbcD/Mre11